MHTFQVIGVQAVSCSGIERYFARQKDGGNTMHAIGDSCKLFAIFVIAFQHRHV
jgi:hypothetical protein